MLIAASCPSNSEAAVTKRSGVAFSAAVAVVSGRRSAGELMAVAHL